jgi:hypothetical protein
MRGGEGREKMGEKEHYGISTSATTQSTFWMLTWLGGSVTVEK